MRITFLTFDSSESSLLPLFKEIMATQAEIVASLTAIAAQVTTIGDGVTKLVAQVGQPGAVTPELESAVSNLSSQVARVAGMLPPG